MTAFTNYERIHVKIKNQNTCALIIIDCVTNVGTNPEKNAAIYTKLYTFKYRIKKNNFRDLSWNAQVSREIESHYIYMYERTPPHMMRD